MYLQQLLRQLNVMHTYIKNFCDCDAIIGETTKSFLILLSAALGDIFHPLTFVLEKIGVGHCSNYGKAVKALYCLWKLANIQWQPHQSPDQRHQSGAVNYLVIELLPRLETRCQCRGRATQLWTLTRTTFSGGQ